MAATDGRELPVVTDAERAVADLLPIEADPVAARRALERVPLWFHTFALNREHGLYTPGVARDHRYRVPFLPSSFAGERVLDVGTFDGFYAFLAEARGAARVVAVDNEQYVDWMRGRFGRRARSPAAGFDDDPRAARLARSSTAAATRSTSTARRALRRRAVLRDAAPGRATRSASCCGAGRAAGAGRRDARRDLRVAQRRPPTPGDRGPAAGRRLRRRRLRLLGLRRRRACGAWPRLAGLAEVEVIDGTVDRSTVTRGSSRR